VHPSQAIEIFDNVSTPFGNLGISDLSAKISRRSSRENPSVGGGGGLNARGVAKYSDFGPFEIYISETMPDMIKLLLISNRKSHRSFRLVPTSVTLNDLERRNSPNGCVISPNSVDLLADYVKVVEYTPALFAAKM